MSVETDPIPPVPRHVPPVSQQESDNSFRFQIPWMQWFIQVREKVNVINSVVTNLSKIVTNGIVVLASSGEWVGREIKGTLDRISVTNGTGAGGDPTVDIDGGYEGQGSITTVGTITDGTWHGDVIENVYLEAAPPMVNTATSATGGSATALPAQPVGYVEILVGGVTKLVPYYDP